MTPTQAPPIARVVRIEWGRVPTVLVLCPYCAEEHRHGAPDGVASGHRVAHCRGRRSGRAGLGYVIEYTDEEATR